MKFYLVRFPGTKAVRFKQQLKITQKVVHAAANTLDLDIAQNIILPVTSP